MSERARVRANERAAYIPLRQHTRNVNGANNVCQGVVEITDSGDVDGDDSVCIEVTDESGAAVTSPKCHTGNIDGVVTLKTDAFTTSGEYSYRANIRSKTTAGSEHYYHDHS